MSMCNSDSDNIKISAILPNYNSVEFLPKSIQSLLDQVVPFTEIIIVDDGSTDNSIALIQEFMKKHDHIRLIKHDKNQGVNQALNTGIAQAVGSYVLLCAADDCYSPNIVSLAKEGIKKFPSVGVICGDAMVDRFDLKSPFYRMLPYPQNTLITPEEFKAITKKSYVGFNSGGGMFINRQAILDAGMLHLATRWHGDWLLYFVAALKQGVYYINEIFIHISMRKVSYSEGKRDKKIQDQVMIDVIDIIAHHYPELWNDFKEAGLVPHHAIRYILLFLSHPVTRRFITVRLIWKILINNEIVVRLGRLFPYRVILGARKLLKA